MIKKFIAIIAAILSIGILTACDPSEHSTSGFPTKLPSIGKTTASEPVPGMTGDYVTVVKGTATFTSICPSSGIKYTGRVDAAGRIGPACGIITEDMIKKSAGSRQTFAPGSDPAGWGHNAEVNIPRSDGTSYHGYFWNRSHMIGDSLGGDAIYDNLITGTRFQNVGAYKNGGGMAYTETETRDYLSKHPTVTMEYEVTPNYTGNEIIPRTNTVNIKSSDGAINETVTVFNQAQGYTIDYMNGTYTKN